MTLVEGKAISTKLNGSGGILKLHFFKSFVKATTESLWPYSWKAMLNSMGDALTNPKFKAYSVCMQILLTF